MRWPRARIGLAALTIAAATACAKDVNGITAGAPGTPAGPVATSQISCERPRVTGTADAVRYASTLEEMVTSADVVAEARIVGDAGAATEASQPMEVEVVTRYRGTIGARLTVQRYQTHYSVTGTPGTFIGSWNGEPWYCPGQIYMLFLQRDADGGYHALPRVGAIPIEPHLDAATAGTAQAPQPFASLATLDADTLRASVRAAADRAGG